MQALTGSSDVDSLVDAFELFSRNHRKIQRGTFHYGPFNESESDRFFDAIARFETLDAIDVAKRWKSIRDSLEEENEAFTLHI